MVEILLLCLATPVFVLLGDWLPRRIIAEDARAVAQFRQQPLPPMPSIGDTARLLRQTDDIGRILLFGGAAMVALAVFGTGLRGGLAGLWVLALLTLLRIDLQYRLLPDLITQPMLWCGLLLQIPESTRTIGLESAILGAITGYLPFRLINDAYRLFRRHDGMGQGDMKLLAALGAVWGPVFVIATYMVATLLALLGRGVLALTRGERLQDPFAFGPAIVYGALLVALASSPQLHHKQPFALGCAACPNLHSHSTT